MLDVSVAGGAFGSGIRRRGFSARELGQRLLGFLLVPAARSPASAGEDTPGEPVRREQGPVRGVPGTATAAKAGNRQPGGQDVTTDSAEIVRR